MMHAGVPDPGVADKILRQLQPGMQCHVAQTMVGAFMSDAAKAKWDRLQDPTCALCGQVDSKTHRLLECPVAAHLRALYQPVLDFIVDEMPHWLHCPYPTACPDEAFLRLFWRSRKLVPPPSIVHLWESLPETVHLFTDGSCQHPQVPAARHAAWAVVAFVGHGNVNVSDFVAYWRQHAVLPPYWHVVARGVVPGLQDINRAEACGLVQAALLADQLPVKQVTIWSDSENALRAVQQSVNNQSPPGQWPFCKEFVTTWFVAFTWQDDIPQG